MRRTLLLRGGLATLAGTGLLATALLAQTPFSGPSATGASQGASPAPIHTNRPAFRIPFQVDSAEISRLSAREVRLFVSTDGGRQWAHAQSVAPQARSFEFHAPADAEYWFAVQTIDQQGQPHPGPPLRPGLAVSVDTTAPEFRVQLQPAGDNRVSLQWNVADPGFDPASLKLEFSQSGQDRWEPVAITPGATGQTSWTVPGGGFVAVRGIVRDRAGNEAQSQDQTQVGRAGGQGTPGSVEPDFSAPIASRQPGGLASNAGGVPGWPAAGNTSRQTPSTPPAMSVTSQQAGGGSTPDGYLATQPAPPEHGVFSAVPGSQFQSSPANGSAGPAWQDRFVSTSPGTANEGSVPAYQEAQPSGHRTVNTRQFQIDYRIDDIGPSGVAAVELFVTQNNGEKWYRYGIDEDRRSPFEVEVPSDGIYGFSMRVVSGAGLSDDPPQSAERPEIVIVVDSSPPVVQLLPLRQGQGADSNRILISWEAADHRLAERPIALSYSASPNGPWQAITDWHPNTGEYIWNVGPGVPARLFIRIVARDAAGNLTRSDTPQPVLVDLAKPTARIVDVDTSVSGRVQR